MTTNHALDLIKAKIGGEDSDKRNVMAQTSLASAIGAFNRIGNFNWNRQYVAFSLTSGTSRYLAEELWPDWTVRKMEPKIWFVGTVGWINIMDYEQFNNLAKYRSTNAGTPAIGAFHSIDKTLDLFPVPDSALSCEVMLYVLITQMDQVPLEYEDLVIDRAVMMAVDTGTPEGQSIYGSCAASWDMGVIDIKNNPSLTVWTGNQIDPDPWVTGAATNLSPSGPDSGNLTG